MTITDKNDLAAALEELVQSADKLSSSGGHGGRASLQHMLPPLRLQLVPVASQVARRFCKPWLALLAAVSAFAGSVKTGQMSVRPLKFRGVDMT